MSPTSYQTAPPRVRCREHSPAPGPVKHLIFRGLSGVAWSRTRLARPTEQGLASPGHPPLPKRAAREGEFRLPTSERLAGVAARDVEGSHAVSLSRGRSMLPRGGGSPGSPAPRRRGRTRRPAHRPHAARWRRGRTRRRVEHEALATCIRERWPALAGKS